MSRGTQEPLLEEDLAFTPQVDFAVFLSGEWMENSTFLSGRPVPFFSVGAVQRASKLIPEG